MRLEAAAILLALVGGACSTTDAVGDYLDEVAEITLTMRNESLTAVSDEQSVTRAGIAAVIEARRRASAALRTLVPPADIAPEHSALVRVLTELTTAGEAFLAATADLDAAEFERAVLAAIDLDEIVARVGVACDAVERRALDLDATVDLAC